VEHAVGTYDDIRAWVKESPGPFARMDCICRKAKDLTGEPCRQTKMRDNCLTIGTAAKAMAARGDGRIISREEMLDLLDRADSDGLVLQPENTLKPMFVCCCCGCCCGVLRSAGRLPRPADMFSTGYRAAADDTLCAACGACEPRCAMGAIGYQEDGRARVDESRCIGCVLCVSTCPSGALRFEARERTTPPPADTPRLYMQMFRERFGTWGVAQLGARRLLGMKF
jgi:ferredoxin